MSAELQATREDAVLILTIANPGTKNVLESDIYAAAIETLSTAERDESLRAVILTGAGKHFCAGTHLPPSNNRTQEVSPLSGQHNQLRGWIDAIRACPKPVIAAVEGEATDAGFSLALACDLILAGTSATFTMDYINMGLAPDPIGAGLLAQALPHPLTLEILMRGKALSSMRLYNCGLINSVVPDGAAFDAALAWANELASLPASIAEEIKSRSIMQRHQLSEGA